MLGQTDKHFIDTNTLIGSCFTIEQDHKNDSQTEEPNIEKNM